MKPQVSKPTTSTLEIKLEQEHRVRRNIGKNDGDTQGGPKK